MADAMAGADPFSNLGSFLPHIDPIIVFLVILAILAFMFICVGGAVFLIAVRKNWIVLRWGYKVTMFKPSGTTIVRFDDKAALIKDERNKIMFRLKDGGFDFEIPDREFIHPGNHLYGWSATMREFIPLKLNFVGYKKSPEGQIIEKLSRIQNAELRKRLTEEYNQKLTKMELQWRPVVDNATINSTIENTSNIVKATPMKSDWLALLGLGVAVMIIILVFMISVGLEIKNADVAIKNIEVEMAQAQAQSALAASLNQSTIMNGRIMQILNRSIATGTIK